jgi:hypothetical protein
MAAMASSQSYPGKATQANPTTTPTEVHTSVTRRSALASRAIEGCTLAALNITQASKPLRAELSTDKAKPQPSSYNGCGSNSRKAAAQMMPITNTCD